MSYQFDEKIYEGKAKDIYAIKDHPGLVGMHFKNSLTAFNGEKYEEMKGKGQVNCAIASFIFDYLKHQGIDSHHVETTGDREMVVRRVEIIPLEVVVRNRWAGSLAKKFNKTEGEDLATPLVEFFYKDDALGDPFVSDDQIVALHLVKDPRVLSVLKEKAIRINQILKSLFQRAGISLVDFKLEFGTLPSGEIVLADEITPDSCRLWDAKTNEKMDKDRFRRDLGDVIENYQKVYHRLKEI